MPWRLGVLMAGRSSLLREKSPMAFHLEIEPGPAGPGRMRRMALLGPDKGYADG